MRLEEAKKGPWPETREDLNEAVAVAVGWRKREDGRWAAPKVKWTRGNLPNLLFEDWFALGLMGRDEWSPRWVLGRSKETKGAWVVFDYRWPAVLVAKEDEADEAIARAFLVGVRMHEEHGPEWWSKAGAECSTKRCVLGDGHGGLCRGKDGLLREE